MVAHEARAIGVIPAHLRKLARMRVMREDRRGYRGLEADALVAAGVGEHGDGGEQTIGVWVVAEEGVRGGEAVDEQAGAAGAVGVLEQVQGLQAGGVGEVGVVGVGVEGFGGVGCVLGGEVGGEVVEGALRG